MLFERLFIQNLGIFTGEHTVELLPKSQTKPIILVGALNGSGKTTVIESIQLALYGKRAKFGWRGSSAYPSYLAQVRNRHAKPIDPTIAEITLKLRDGRRLRVRRQWDFVKDTPREYVSVYVGDNEAPDPTLSETWDDEVERMLPARLSELFFFDGERIESLADPTRSGEVLRTAMASLLGLDLVDHLTTDLDILRARQRQRMLTPEQLNDSVTLETKIRAKHQSIEDLRQRISQLANDIKQAEKTVQRMAEDVQEKGGDRFQQREHLVVERAKASAELAHAEMLLKDLVADALPLALVEQQLRSIREHANDQSAHASPIATAAVKHQLEQLKKWAEDQDYAAKVKAGIKTYVADELKKLKQLAKTENPALALGGPHALGKLAVMLDEQLPRARTTAAELPSHAASLAERVDRLDEQLKRVPEQEQVAELFKALGAAEGALQNLKDESRYSHEQIHARERELAELGRANEKVFANKIEASDAQRTIEYCERSLRTLAEYRGKLIQKRREQLEALILESFRVLSRKANLIGGIRLDPETMALTLQTGDGEAMLPQQLSAGERQLLAVAMLWGLARASGRPVPVVIDTPLGRLDGEHRTSLVKRYFPQASHQVILLSTDQEVNADLSQQLSKSVSRRYLISYDARARRSVFSDGYFS